MVDYGVTENGFVTKSYAEIVANLHANARRMFGPDVDLTPGSPIKIMIDIFALEMTGLWSNLKTSYESGFVPTATGTSLDNMAKLVGVKREEGYEATGEVTFKRTTAMPDGSPRIIPAGTVVKTAAIYPVKYATTSTVYFEPTITDETQVMEVTGTSVDCENIIHSIVSIVDEDSNDLTAGATFTYRSITLPSEVSAGKTVYITYKPLSVTAPVQAQIAGVIGNVPIDTITVMDSPIDFIHSVTNESAIDTGYDTESDVSLRDRIIGATQSVGKATGNALDYYIGKVSGVKNVVIENPLTTIVSGETETANGTSTFYVDNTPVASISSVTGSTGGSYTVSDVNEETGEITLEELTTNGETLTIDYSYYTPGKMKIYVEGGVTGDETIPDTIVYAIEQTRAAGVQAVGYGTGDTNAYGSSTAPFSWFYRPDSMQIDIDITVYFDDITTLTEVTKDAIIDNIESDITEYINKLSMQEKIYKNKIIQLAIGNDDNIVDAQLNSWSVNDVSQSTDLTYLQGDATDIPVMNVLTVTKATEV